MLLRIVLAAHQHGRGAVGQRRGGAGGDRAALRKAGFSCARPAAVVSGRMQPSVSTVPPLVRDRHDFVAKLPAFCAAAALLLAAHRERLLLARGVICHLRATFSAVSPMPI